MYCVCAYVDSGGSVHTISGGSRKNLCPKSAKMHEWGRDMTTKDLSQRFLRPFQIRNMAMRTPRCQWRVYTQFL